MSITLEPKLQTKLTQLAERLGRSVEEIAGEAIRTHLEELDALALADEEQAFQRLYPELRQHHLHQFVAIHAGRFVDTDPEFEPLFLRVQARLGDHIVLVRQVGDTPHQEYQFRSPRLERPNESTSL